MWLDLSGFHVPEPDNKQYYDDILSNNDVDLESSLTIFSLREKIVKLQNTPPWQATPLKQVVRIPVLLLHTVPLT